MSPPSIFTRQIDLVVNLLEKGDVIYYIDPEEESLCEVDYK